MTVEIITLIAFCSIALVIFLIGLRIRKFGRDPIARRLAAAARGDSDVDAGAIAKSLANELPQLSTHNSRLDKELRRAGHYDPDARREFWTLRWLFALLAIFTTSAVVVAVSPGRRDLAFQVLLFGLAATVLIWALPRLFLSWQANRRVERIRRALPDSLDMLTMGLSGGLALPEGLAHVSNELYTAHPDLAVELVILRQHADMISFDKAMQYFADRMDDSEINSMAALLSHGRRLGTNIVSSVRDYADGMRRRRRQDADERSSKAAVKMLFPVVLCLLPSVFILLTGPAILELWQFLITFDGGVPPAL